MPTIKDDELREQIIELEWFGVVYKIKSITYAKQSDFISDVRGLGGAAEPVEDIIAHTDTYSVKENKDISAIVRFNANPTINDIAHEAVHISSGIVARRWGKDINLSLTYGVGTDTEEDLAQLVGYITNELSEALIHTHDIEGRKSHYDYNMKGSWVFIGDIDKLNSLNDLYWSYVMEVVAEADPRAVERGVYSIDYIKNNMKHASWGSVGIYKILARADQRAKERIAELKALQSKKKGMG